ncbi:unnamed protein product [Rotaria sp. Silwood1]|nr:unnamed protein product [Rotaria sp. Silwood1]CAF1315983.1 unnamed protein product [Rotaria sp. Silwood1]CAF3536128.1 unnamed protein product [Rotaria sp. Silwood1]CAF4820747.1 unnamed protein product [Rotaria sp. Silwood1]
MYHYLFIVFYRKTSSWPRRKFPTAICAVATFTIIVMAVGILIVCFTSSKDKNKICKLTFKPTVKYAIGYDSLPLHAAVGDFNNDNHQDLAVAFHGIHSIGVFFGYGNGTFRNQIEYGTGPGSAPYWVAVTDFNNDTLLDIAVAHYGTNSIGVFLGSGGGNFTNQTTFSLGSSQPLSLVIGDFNNDHHQDIAVANSGTSNIAILLGLNNGSFYLESTIDMGFDSNPCSLVAADFNNDKQIDIAVVDSGVNTLTILLGSGLGTFVKHKYSTGSGSNPSSLVFGDFDNDNILDIIVANNGTKSLGLFLGYRNGTFRNMITGSAGPDSSPQFIVASDFDNDRNLDLVVVNTNYNNIYLLRGYGDGNFSLAATHETGPSSTPNSIVTGDFDNDNRPDVAVLNFLTNNILILSSYAVHPDATRWTYSTGADSRPDSIAVGDFNHDNQLDIVVANINSSSIGIFLGLDDGSFESPRIYFIGKKSRPQSVVVGDFNNDSNLDIVIGISGINSIRIYLGNGNGSFKYTKSYPIESSYPFLVAVGDFNKDNNLDIVTAIYDNNKAGIFLGDGNGNFTIIKTDAPESDPYMNSVAVGDFNQDGFLDFAVSHYRRATISIHLGYGNGSFHILMIISTGFHYPRNIAIGDLNNDGQLDLIFADPYSASIDILCGYENGAFGNITMYSTGAGSCPWSVALADLNNDTFLDIVVVNQWYFSIGIIPGYGNGTFGAQDMFSTGFGSLSSSIVLGDFNNDNQLDIAVSNTGTNDIHVFLISFNPDFTKKTSILTGSRPHPFSLVIGDFNKNNRTDIAVTNAGIDNVQIFLDYEKETFMNKFVYPTGFGSRPQYITTANINNDNHLDIVVANYWMDNINIFFGIDNGTFDEPTVHSTGLKSLPSSVTVGDFQKDGWMDMVVANDGTDSIGIFLGFDYPTFTSDSILLNALTVVPFYIVAADFDNDNQLDIAVSYSEIDLIDILLGTGNGSLIYMASYSTSSVPTVMVVGDFNNDKQLDIAVANADGFSFSVFLGYGNGKFAEQNLYSTGSSSPGCIAVGDFNQDGNLDIVVANKGNEYIRVFIGHGNGTFTEKISYWTSTNSSVVWIIVDDFNNDHIPDLAIASQYNDEIEILLGYGNGLFRNATKYSTGYYSSPYSIAAGDLNNDGSIDIAVTNQDTKNIGIFFGHGNGTFSSQTTIPIGFESILTMIAIADLNNDTILDIVVSDLGKGDGNISVLYGYGYGKFAMLKTYSTGVNSYPTCFVIYDFNNDNRVDLAIIIPNTATIIIMLRDKITPFATQITISIGNDSSPTSVAVGDFNNDDRLDIAVANAGTHNIGILLGHGNGSFDEQTTYSTGDSSNPVWIVVNDFNNDHQLDIIVANFFTSNIGIFFGYGNGTFAEIIYYSTGIGSSPCSIAVADLDKDNRLDLVVANLGTNNIVVFYGLDNGVFGNPLSYSVNYNARPVSVSIGDFNYDGWLDIAVACYGTDYVEIFLQTC